MSFNSSILTEQPSASLFELESITEKSNDDILIDILEFNNEAHVVDLAYKCKQYCAIVEAHNNGTEIILAESVKSSIENLKQLLDQIIDFIKKVIATITNKSRKATKNFETVSRETNGFEFKFDESQFEQIFRSYWEDLSYNGNRRPNTSRADAREDKKRAVMNRIRSIDNEEFEFKRFTYHDPSQINDNDVKCALTNLTTALYRILNDKEEYTSTDADLEIAYKAMRRRIRDNRREFDGLVNSGESFKKWIMTNVVYEETKTETFNSWRQYASNVKSTFGQNFVASRCAGMIEELDKAKAMFDRAKDTITPETVAQAKVLISQIKKIVDSWCWYINYTSSMHDRELIYIVKNYERIQKLVYKSSINEAGFIHGEEFNSDTLFANEDMRDFNPTEWMDLELTTECYTLNYAMLESAANIALEEAKILTDDEGNKYTRLIAMREAEQGKMNSAISNIMAKIKEIITTFFNNIKDRNGANAKFIKENMELINKPIKPDAKITSRGNILAGFYRMQKPLNIEPFNYEMMKNDLADKKTFFKNKILPHLNEPSNFSKRKNLAWNDEMSITEYCKLYFGYSANTDKYPACVFTGQEMETNKGNIVKYLQNTNIIGTIKSDLDKVENIIKQSGIDMNGHQPQNQDQNKPQQEGYFSMIYNTMILSEVQMEGMKDEKTSNGDNVANEANDKAGAARVYLEVYKDVILSKATAAEFVLSELMAIIRAHTGKPASAKPQQNQNTQQAPQPQNPPQQ